MLAHNPATRNMSPREFMGNLVLLIVGGNDTTRNSMTGGLLALSRYPDEWAKLRANPGAGGQHGARDHPLADPAAAHAPHRAGRRRTGGKKIKSGDKVVMWYLSGNRDDEAIDNPEAFIIDRARPRQHLSFGFGIHRCVGNRLAEMQLKILWEEILKRFPVIEVTSEPKRMLSNFVRGITDMRVRIPG